MKVIILGLPGSGKTTLAQQLKTQFEACKISVSWYNADRVRKQFDDWDFSDAGRLRQARRMRELANSSGSDIILCDFVAPTEEIRKLFDADYTVWVDTIELGRFEDTNRVFEEPAEFDIRVSTKDCEMWSDMIIQEIKRRNQ